MTTWKPGKARRELLRLLKAWKKAGRELPNFRIHRAAAAMSAAAEWSFSPVDPRSNRAGVSVRFDRDDRGVSCGGSITRQQWVTHHNQDHDVLVVFHRLRRLDQQIREAKTRIKAAKKAAKQNEDRAAITLSNLKLKLSRHHNRLACRLMVKGLEAGKRSRWFSSNEEYEEALEIWKAIVRLRRNHREQRERIEDELEIVRGVEQAIADANQTLMAYINADPELAFLYDAGLLRFVAEAKDGDGELQVFETEISHLDLMDLCLLFAVQRHINEDTPNVAKALAAQFEAAIRNNEREREEWLRAHGEDDFTPEEPPAPDATPKAAAENSAVVGSAMATPNDTPGPESSLHLFERAFDEPTQTRADAAPSDLGDETRHLNGHPLGTSEPLGQPSAGGPPMSVAESKQPPEKSAAATEPPATEEPVQAQPGPNNKALERAEEAAQPPGSPGPDSDEQPK
jgi:hypothetical protein